MIVYMIDQGTEAGGSNYEDEIGLWRGVRKAEDEGMTISLGIDYQEITMI